MTSSPHATEALVLPQQPILAAATPPKATLASVAKHAALPVAIGAGVAAVASAIILMRSPRPHARPQLVVFEKPKGKPGLVGVLVKASLVALARGLLKWAITPRGRWQGRSARPS